MNSVPAAYMNKNYFAPTPIWLLLNPWKEKMCWFVQNAHNRHNIIVVKKIIQLNPIDRMEFQSTVDHNDCNFFLLCQFIFQWHFSIIFRIANYLHWLNQSIWPTCRLFSAKTKELSKASHKSSISLVSEPLWFNNFIILCSYYLMRHSFPRKRVYSKRTHLYTNSIASTLYAFRTSSSS